MDGPSLFPSFLSPRGWLLYACPLLGLELSSLLQEFVESHNKSGIIRENRHKSLQAVECSGAVKWWDCDNVEVCEDTCTASAMVEIPGTPEELLTVENEGVREYFFGFFV